MKALYEFSMNPMMWGMARMSRKSKSFRLAPHIAAAVERAAQDLGRSEGEIIDYCVANSIAKVVEDEIKSTTAIVDEGALTAFKSALTAFQAAQQTPGYKRRHVQPRGPRRKK